MKYIILLFIGEAIGWYVCMQLQFPSTIEQRLKDLDLMKYDSKTEKFIPKDSVILRSSEINYLINGTTKTGN